MLINPYALDHALLNQGETRWGNLGYWATATRYPIAAAALAQQLGDAANLQPTDHVLDLAFGAGESLLFWREHYGITHLVGQELLASQVQVARQRLIVRHLLCNVLCGSATQLEHFASASFNKVLALDSAYHFQPREQFFRQSYQLLKSGGRLALTDLALAQFPRNNISYAMLHLAAFAAAIPPANLLSIAAYRQQLEQVGFVNIQIQPIEAQVFAGFAHFIARHARTYLLIWPRLSWGKLLGTGLLLRWLARHDWLHYLLITADKP